MPSIKYLMLGWYDICKLKAHGISGKILTWIENWLLNRKQSVVVNGKLSWLIDVLSGVPQGSILGE